MALYGEQIYSHINIDQQHAYMNNIKYDKLKLKHDSFLSWTN